MKSEDQKNWQKSKGVLCFECRNEALCIVDGLCRSCYELKAKDYQTWVENVVLQRYFTRGLRNGTVNIQQMREGRV